MSTFKPLLASPANLDDIKYPVFGSPKLDGIRATIHGGRLMSRKLIEIPNRHVQDAILRGRDQVENVTAKLLRESPLEGLDGELIDGDATAHDVYRRTNSLVMSHDKPITSDLQLWVFDDWSTPNTWYEDRYDGLAERVKGHPFLCVLQQTLLKNRDELDEFEARAVEKGYEGIMLRSLKGLYKFGRSTAKEGILLKLKRFEDSEAEILRVEEEMANMNEAGRDALGRTKRSTAKDGKVGKGTMGALVVRDLTTGVEFNIGTGFTAADRAGTWKPGEIVKYKSFPVGVKDKPRHPVFLGLRSKIDL